MNRPMLFSATLLALGAAACAANTRTATYGGTVPSRSEGLSPASAGAGGTKEPDAAGVTAADSRGKPAPETVSMGGGIAATKAALLTRGWPTESRDAAVALELKLGPPAEVDESHLTWNNAGGWKRITVHRAGETDDTHLDVIDVVVDYDVPNNEAAETIARLNAGLAVQGESNEISAWCETEAQCILALNLANDLVTGRQTLDEAKQAWERGLSDLGAGRAVPASQRLQFEVKRP